MTLQTIRLTNFRSYEEQALDLNSKVTLVVGPNATGKTNLLEGVFVLATTRSFRAKDKELIKHGASSYRLVGRLPNKELGLGYQLTPDGGAEKKGSHDGVKKSLASFVGSIRAVLFEPNDLLLIYGNPDKRRRYLDFILAQTKPTYLTFLHNYQRALRQRNRLLGDWAGDASELFAWNLKLVEPAIEINQHRQQLINSINTFAPNVYQDIAGAPADLTLEYSGPQASDHQYYLQALEQNQSRDIAAGFTTTGPHREDFKIKFKGSDIANLASRGEMRSVILALKMSEREYIENQTNQKPILLLDDVFSELDDKRRSYLLKTLAGYQSIITTTNADMAGELAADCLVLHTKGLQNA